MKLGSKIYQIIILFFFFSNLANSEEKITTAPLINIEEGAFIGAGAVVTKDVKKNEVVVGNPAKFLKLKTHKVDLKLFK